MKAVYLDTNVFVAAFETSGILSECAWTLLDSVSRGEMEAHTSELTLAELLVKPLRLGSDLLVELYTGLIATGGMLTVMPVSRAILVNSARIRIMRSGLKLPDSIHVASAIEAGCHCLVTHDHRLLSLSSLPVIALSRDAARRIADLSE